MASRTPRSATAGQYADAATENDAHGKFGSMTIAEASALARPKHTPTLRCFHLLRHLTEHAKVILGDEDDPLGTWNHYIDALMAIPHSLTAADEYVVSLTEAESPSKMHFALFAAAMYAVQAMKADESGELNAAWDLAFDASQWESLIEGLLAGGDASKVDEAVLARVQKFEEAHRPVADKTEYYLEVMKKVPDKKSRNKATAARVFLDAPKHDDGTSPFFWRGRDSLIDRSNGEPISVQQMTAQIQKARERHARGKKTQRQVS